MSTFKSTVMHISKRNSPGEVVDKLNKCTGSQDRYDHLIVNIQHVPHGFQHSLQGFQHVQLHGDYKMMEGWIKLLNNTTKPLRLVLNYESENQASMNDVWNLNGISANIVSLTWNDFRFDSIFVMNHRWLDPLLSSTDHFEVCYNNMKSPTEDHVGFGTQFTRKAKRISVKGDLPQGLIRGVFECYRPTSLHLFGVKKCDELFMNELLGLLRIPCLLTDLWIVHADKVSIKQLLLANRVNVHLRPLQDYTIDGSVISSPEEYQYQVDQNATSLFGRTIRETYHISEVFNFYPLEDTVFRAYKNRTGIMEKLVRAVTHPIYRPSKTSDSGEKILGTPRRLPMNTDILRMVNATLGDGLPPLPPDDKWKVPYTRETNAALVGQRPPPPLVGNEGEAGGLF